MLLEVDFLAQRGHGCRRLLVHLVLDLRHGFAHLLIHLDQNAQ